MNKKAAISRFNEYISRLSRLPLITDDEMNELFGEEVAAALVRLSILDRKERLCSSCLDKCCRIIKCELFTSRFEQCPIHELRPALCRLHYCRAFGPEHDAIIKELGDIFFDSLAEAQHRGSARVDWFDSPPLAAACPELVKAASQWVEAVANGTLDHQRASQMIREEAEKHRTPN